MKNTFGALMFVAVLLGSCSGKLSEREYVKWVSSYDNGLHVQKEEGSYVFDVQFQPADYMMLQRKATLGAMELQEGNQEDGMQYFLLTIGVKEEGEDFIDYHAPDKASKQRKLYYYSYQFQNDIRLEEAGTVLPCLLFHFERPVDLKHSRTFVLAFEQPKEVGEEVKLIIASEYLGSNPVEIKVSKQNIPALKI